MKKFKEGDVLTLEDVKESMQELERIGRRKINENTVKPTVRNGALFFDSIEEAERYYGGPLRTVDEVFKDIAKKYEVPE